MAEAPTAVAIIGMAAVFPGSSTLDEYWGNICDGVDAITEVSPDRWDPVYFDPEHGGIDRFYCRRGGFVDTQAVLDPVALGIVPNSVDNSEPDQLLSLALAARAVADAGGEGLGEFRERAGVIVGRGGYLTPGVARLDQRVRTSEQLVIALQSLLPGLDADDLARVKAAFVEHLGPDRADAAIDLVPNLAASRVANRLDLGGPAYTVDAACASSLLAVDQAVHELQSGRCDMVIAGGVHLCHDVTLWSVFTQLGALSRTEKTRPFDRRADGLLVGEGGGMVVLQRLEDAEKSGARIYAVIRGTGVASDGRSASLMRPAVSGQVRALERAWRRAGVNPATLGLVEAHGTGTPAGDITEVETLQAFFGHALDGKVVGLGSVKSMIGHTMPAAGIAGLIKAALAVHHGVLPPTLHCEQPLAELEGSPFTPIGVTRPWEAKDHLRVATVNAFGFGGINGHVVLEQHPAGAGRNGNGNGNGTSHAATSATSATTPSPAPSRQPTDPVLLLAAGSLEEMLAQLDSVDLASFGATPVPRQAPAGGPFRLALLRPSEERLALARKVVSRGRQWHGRSDVWFTPQGLATTGGKVAFVFPGVEPSFEPRVHDVAAHFGLPVPPLAPSDAVAEDLEGLGRSLIAVGRLLHTAVTELGLKPDLAAGQSIGEWSGMIATNMIPPADVDGFINTLRPGSLVVPGVEFAALGCSVETAEQLIGDDPDLAISHDNCPHQTIICGHDSFIVSLMERARAGKVLGQVLPFRSGFHTPMFEPFLGPFREALARLPLQEPDVTLWSSTTCAPYPVEPDAIRHLAVAHLVERVRFRELTLALHEAGARIFVQVGVGSLPGLIEDSLSGRELMAVATNSPRRSGMDQLLRAAAACWVEGVEGIAFDRFSEATASGDAAPETGQSATSHNGEAAPRVNPLTHPGLSAPRSSAHLRTLPLASPMVRLEPLDLSHALSGPRAGQPLRADHAVQALGGAVGAELQALLDEVAAATGAVAEVLENPPPPRPIAPTPVPTSEAASSHVQAPEPTPAPVPGTAPTPTPSPIRQPAQPPTPAAPAHITTKRLSVDDIPALVDHCFYRQPPGWPSMADHFPVVPMTALLEIMGEAAAAISPGMVVIGLEEVRALRWLAVAPPVEVIIRATPLPATPPPTTGSPLLAAHRSPTADQRKVRVVIDGYSRATVVLAPNYPEPTQPTAATKIQPLVDAAPCPLNAEHLYEDRWMFHGPEYQGVVELGPMGPGGIDGTLVTPAAPGALLDNAGQLMGLWMMFSSDHDRLALPTSIDRITFTGPEPPVGTNVETAVRISNVDELSVTADMELEVAGRPWARIDGWTDKRFDSDELVWPLLIWPERSLLVEDHGGWVLASERWRSSASRELMMRRYMAEEERERYAAHNPRAQRLFLLGRIAAKDAARRWLWAHGAGPLWPVEIQVENLESGRPVLHVPGDVDLRVSIAHSQWVGVAVVAEGIDVGIDVENVEERSEQFASTAFGHSELGILSGGGPTVDDEWLTRGWAAKEALAKARGTGLGGRPRQFTIEARHGETLVVDGHRVPTTRLGDLVVAHTSLGGSEAPGW